jgi:hypothetical protein
MSTPMYRIRSLCCARATTGQAAAAPPRSVMKSRRFIRSLPSARTSMDVGTLVLRKFSSQCALWMPIGDTSRRKILRYQQTARNVLNRGGGRPLKVSPNQTSVAHGDSAMSLDSRQTVLGPTSRPVVTAAGRGHRRSALPALPPQSSVTAVLVAGAATERGVDPPPCFVRAW